MERHAAQEPALREWHHNFNCKSWYLILHSKMCAFIKSDKLHIPSTYLKFDVICDILGYHRFSKERFFADYLNVSQVGISLLLGQGVLIL
jgi:hypothetical protein